MMVLVLSDPIYKHHKPNLHCNLKWGITNMLRGGVAYFWIR
jgi:hypothetical protein